MAVLPRPDINVTQQESGQTDVVISRDGKARTYSSKAPAGSQQVIKEIVRQIIDDDRFFREWLP